jgi:segregation and condensation protein A
LVPDTDYRIRLPVFEGPLDLLLFLIRKNELDIYDIPIESVTRQYVAVLRSMRQLDLEVAGDFFVMAATLMEIKSRMLLPRGEAAIDLEAEDDGFDPRWELVHQLLQYKKFKEAAVNLGALAAVQRDLLSRHVTLPAGDRPLLPVDRIGLWNVFNLVLRRLAEKLVVGEIADEQVTVADKMEELLELVRVKKTFVFSELFPDRVTLRVLVATFLAVLELTRLRRLTIKQDEIFAEIVCFAADEIPLETPLDAAMVLP